MTACPYCGCDLPAPDGGKPRSYPQLKRYMALCRRAYENWPELHDVQFTNWHECRKWLEMKAGYRELVLQQPLMGIPEAKLVPFIQGAIMGVVRSKAGRKSRVFAHSVIHRDVLYVYCSISVKYESMPHKDFCELSDKVERLIREITGVGAEELKLMEQAA